MGQRFPVLNLTAKEKWQPADAEIRVLVGHHNGYLCIRINLFSTQGRTDTGIAAADDSDVLHFQSPFLSSNNLVSVGLKNNNTKVTTKIQEVQSKPASNFSLKPSSKCYQSKPLL